MSNPVQCRYDFVYLFDVTDGNPNGDPDAGNLPRMDPETGHGLVTDVCLKRKIRNFVALVHQGRPPYEIYVKDKAILNQQHQRAYVAENIAIDRQVKGNEKNEQDRRLTQWMCANFFDIRAFGAVMTTEINAGQVRGPIQLTMARSVDPIIPQELALTRCAVTTEREAEKQGGINQTIARKFVVPYGLYMGFGYVNATLAAQTGFDEEDLALFKQALNMMFENDRSATRGRMAPVRCVAFRHRSKLGNARADQLFSGIKIVRTQSVSIDLRPARSKDDYSIITPAPQDLPDGVSLEEWI